jgi:phenylacetate-coenzyme A ligase PaaK-like adenylate-forming protein
MLEPWIRSNFARLTPIYERFPAPARHLLTSARGWFLAQLRYSTETMAILAKLRQQESRRPEEIARAQVESLRAAYEHARRTVPFYANYPAISIRSTRDLEALPILDRETVRRNQEQLQSSETPSHRRIRAGTTGTTGANLRVAYTEDLVRRNWAFLLRQWAWAGIEPRHPRVTFFGARIVPANRTEPPYWTQNWPDRQTLMSIFHLSEKTAPAYLEYLRRQRGKVLEGFPSVLGILADFALQAGEPIPMRAVFTSGEPLYPEIRAKIERAFRARVFDSYGMTEYCGLIQECERGGMHLIPEYGYLEIVDDGGQLCAAGEEGYFVWTGFLNRAMPLVRYRIGDRGRWQSGESCECGRAFPLVVPTITRESDILHCPDGRLFSPRALNQLLKESSSLRFCQFVHDRPGRVVVRAVPSNGHSTADMMQIRASLQDLLGTEMQVTAEIATAPVVRPGGKIPLIVNQVER